MTLDKALADVQKARRVEIETRKLALHQLSELRSWIMRELEAMPEQYRDNSRILAGEAFDWAADSFGSKFGDIADSLPSDAEVEENYEIDIYHARGDAMLKAE